MIIDLSKVRAHPLQVARGSIKKGKKHLYWTTRDDETFLISEMGDNHLVNCLNMLFRKAKREYDDEIQAGLSCLSTVTGEMASYYMERDFGMLLDQNPLDWFFGHNLQAATMLKEAVDRKLIGEDYGFIQLEG